MNVSLGVPGAAPWADGEVSPRAAAGGWILACVAAESVGMTAAASAARAAEGLPASAVLVLVVLGGLVEGLALGVLQGMWLARRYPGVSRAAWARTTVLIAGAGWALASAPSALGDPGGAPPSPPAIVVLAAGLGLAMGAVLGAGQALVLRRHVRYPWRWIWISAVAWAPAMAVIFAGATLPDASWQTAPVIGLGALTGIAAGAVLGLVSMALMRTLTGPSLTAGVVGWLLRRGEFGLGAAFTLLRVRGTRSGLIREFPVQYARDGGLIVVFPARAERKRWWRNLRRPAELSLWIDHRWQHATGHAIGSADAGYPRARSIYSARWPRITVPENAILTRIELRADERAG